MRLFRSKQEKLLDDLQQEINQRWARVGLGKANPFFRSRRDDGSPHVEVRGARYDIVVTERGSENQRVAGLCLEDAARWFVFGMAAGHAQRDELRMRTAPKDAPKLPHGLTDDGYSRWNWMAPAIGMMEKISAEWGEWARKDYQAVLRRAPLQDYEKRNARFPLPPDAD